MLMNIKCSAVTSVAVHLEFDEGTVKDATIATGDLIDVEYNKNGIRRRCQGKVIKISTVGTDPKGWYIIIDGSDSFECGQDRFSPASILDLEIIHKADTIQVIQTPNDSTKVPYLRIVKGRLQWSDDGVHWRFIIIDRKDIIIKNEEGTLPDYSCDNINVGDDTDDTIKDEEGI